MNFYYTGCLVLLAPRSTGQTRRYTELTKDTSCKLIDDDFKKLNINHQISVFKFLVLDLWRGTGLENQYILAEREEINTTAIRRRKNFINRIGEALKTIPSGGPKIYQNTVNLWKLDKKIGDSGGYLQVIARKYFEFNIEFHTFQKLS